MHVGFINFDNQKMSKSLGNVVLAKDAIEKYGGNVIRHFFFTSYYRSPINYTLEAIETSKQEVEKYQAIVNKINGKIKLNKMEFSGDFDNDSYEEFLNYLADDLNVANALMVVDRLAKKANQLLRTNQINLTEISSTYNTYMKMMDVLGLKFEVPNINQEDIYNYEQYQQFRLQKDYANSDIYRIKLIEKGLI